MGFFVLGINHKECPIEIREKMHFNSRQLEEALQFSKADALVSELVILSTCNRVEFYGFSENPGVCEEACARVFEKTHNLKSEIFSPYFYRHEGKDAMRHLFCVAAGLDSLVIGENEILGQLRDAFKKANELEAVHSVLYRLMEKALKVGKDVRTQTKLNEGAVSIPSVAVELAEKIFGKLHGEKIMIIGTGEMSGLTLKNLRSAGAEPTFIASRNPARGHALAAEFEAEWIALEDWPEKLPQTDIVISSTASSYPIIRFEHVRKAMASRKHKPLFMIDIAVPRDIEPEVNTLDDVYVYNVDDLKGVAASNLKFRQREIQAAETLVEKAVLDYQGWLERLKSRPVIESFEDFIGGIIEKELEPLWRDRRISEEEKKQIAGRIRAKLMHPPLEKIKEASQNGGVKRYLEALHSLFNLEKKIDS